MNIWRIFFFFQLLLILILLGVQYYFYRNISRYLAEHHSSRPARIVLNSVFVLFNLPLVCLLVTRPQLGSFPAWVIDGGVYPLYIWHFSLFLLFVVIMIGKFLKIPVVSTVWLMSKFDRTEQWIHVMRRRKEIHRYDSRRRAFLRQGATVLAGAAFTGSAYGAFSRDHFELTEIDIPVSNLPKEFDGFTVGLISDIHSSVFMTREQMAHYVAAVNSLNTDLVTVTGDFVNSTVDEVYPFAEAFSELRAPSGVYGVLGNHDYYTRNVELVAREVGACGIRLLRNEHVPIVKGAGKIILAGIDDVGSNERAARLMDVSVRSSGDATTRILMCHRPYFFEQAETRKFDLTLSGHTHGGQIVFARIGTDVLAPARVASPYVAGIYTINESAMYVSRGIGTVGVPIRINCPPEITKIRLVRK